MFKYTADGKKVAIIGALNAKETIVQEVFVKDGTEFPAGEHFVVKTLLDAPPETYASRSKKLLEAEIQTMKAAKEKMEKELKDFQLKCAAATAKLKWLDGITDTELETTLDAIKAAVCCEYTHMVVECHSGYDILEWGPDSFATFEDRYGRSFDGIKLVSLFGNWNDKRLNLQWKYNSYRDGSGSNYNFFPTKSYEEAVEQIKKIIYAKDHLSDNDYDICLKYNIEVDQEKNSRRLLNKRSYIQRSLEEAKKRCEKLEADLAEIK